MSVGLANNLERREKKNKFGSLGRQALMLPRRRGVEKFQKVNVVSLLKLFDNTKLLEHSVDRLTPHSLLPRLLGTFYRNLFP